jgi:flavorubredoxin
MTVKIIYFSATGNTRKVAEAMADELGCEAEPMGQDASGVSADVLFLGAAVYATFDHDVNPAVRDFIAKLDPAKVKKTVLFCTGFAETALVTMQGLLAKRNIPVSDNTFFCKGKLFVVFNFGHPNRDDLVSARKFARSAVSSKK